LTTKALCGRSSGGSGGSSSSSAGGSGSNADGTSGNTIDSTSTAFTTAEDKVVSSISLEDKLMKRIASFRERSSINISSELLKNLRRNASSGAECLCIDAVPVWIRASERGWLATGQLLLLRL
jgi:hypothetical protein